MDADQPIAEMVAVQGDKIIYVGSKDKLPIYKGENSQIIDLAQNIAIPGIIEGHAHFMGVGAFVRNLDLTQLNTWSDAVTLVEEKVAKVGKGDWIMGRGWHQEKWQSAPPKAVKGFPTHHTMSAISEENPVILRHASGHGLFANAKAMELAGVDKHTKDPEGGEIVHDKAGNPTGIFLETAADLITAQYNKWKNSQSPEEIKKEYQEIVQDAMQHCLENGVTSFQDAGSAFKTIELFKSFADKNALATRLWVMVSSEENITSETLKKYKMVNYGDNFLTVNAIKQYADGALGSRGAWMIKPYSDMQSTSGEIVTPLDYIDKITGLAKQEGYQICTHAIGDRANREILSLYEKHLNGDTSKRWRIEHAQHININDIPRFSELGVIAAMQTVHCTSDGSWVPKRIGEARSEEGAYVWQKLLKTGAHIANGTDAPVEKLNPMANYFSAVTRKLNNGNIFYPKQKLNRMDALKSMTIWNAYAAFEEDIKGSLETGKLADITILSKDILTIPEEEILNTKVKYTIVGGKILFQQ